MLEAFGRFMLLAVIFYGVLLYYEKYEIPRRLQAARERLIFLCEDTASNGADCRHLKPLLMKCE